MSREKSGLGYNVLYAAVLALVCAGLLTAAAEALAPFREANERAATARDVLVVLGIPCPEDASSAEVVRLAEERVSTEQRGSLTFYRAMDERGRVRAVAVPFTGRGLWGPVTGWLALEPDLATIRAITFRAPEETPGFGGEIVKEPFRDRFRGKHIYGPAGEAGFAITRGEGPTGPNEIHALSGATLTSDKVRQILDDLARRIAQETRTP